MSKLLQLLRFWLFLSCLVLFLVPSALAGEFSINAWTNDASSGIGPGQTLWAYHFGSTNIAVVNGVTVPGTGTNVNPSIAGQFSMTGVSFVFENDANSLTALGGSGSAVMASSFLYGGAPWRFTVQGLTAGQVYTVSIYGVGRESPPATRASYFTNGTDTIYVDENSLGSGKGLRVDYTFTATATTNLTIVMPTNTSTFHTYALALQQPFLVTTTSNAGPGSLRQAVLDAGALPGAKTITFAPTLSGAVITLASEIELSGGVTIDASSLPRGITISGGNATRIFARISGATCALIGLTLIDGNGAGPWAGGGGAIINLADLSITRCTFRNSGTGGGGGAIGSCGTLTLTQCTLSDNSAPYGGAIVNEGGTLTLTRCTLAANHSTFTDPADAGGAIYNYFGGELIMTGSVLAGNTAATGFGPDLWMEDGTLATTA
jgi:hypothetical protein